MSEEVWQQANDRARGRSVPLAPLTQDWLTGRVFCASCGRRLARLRHIGKNYWYWRCPKYPTKECPIRLGHARDALIRQMTAQHLGEFLADPRIREAKLAQLGAALADPGWEDEAGRQRAEADRLKAKLVKLLGRFGDDPELEEALGQQVEALKAQIAARQAMVGELEAKLVQSRRAAGAVQQVRGLLGPLPTSFEELPEQDKRLVCQTVGLRVEVARSVPGQVAVQVRVFDFEFLEAFLLNETFQGQEGRFSRKRPSLAVAL